MVRLTDVGTMGNTEEKKEIRKQIRFLKARTSQEERELFSKQLQRKLENHQRFKSAKTLLLYSALPDEPDTKSLMRKWIDKKTILLPVVVGQDLVLKVYKGEDMMDQGAFGIEEPQGNVFSDYDSIDLAIIPGVAFDRALNRLGRGRGYYDRLLAHPDFRAYKMGYCFPFQMVDNVPTEPHDYKMDEIIF